MGWLALFALSLNFKPPDYRPWNRLRRGPFNFKPNRQLQMKSGGDLARLRGLRSAVVREQTFTTDAWGFRNPGRTENPRVVVAGDSYAAGDALNDDETITAQMSRLLGEPVYNYAGEGTWAPAEFLADPRFTSRPPQVLVYAPVFRGITPFPLDISHKKRPWLARVYEFIVKSQGFRFRLDRDNYLAAIFKIGVARVSPQLLAGLSTFVTEINVSGETKLTLSLELQGLMSSPAERQLPLVVQNLEEFNNRLQARGIHLVFAPIPEPGSVYPDSYPGESRIGLQRPPFVDLLFNELKAREIDYVDLRPAFIANRLPYLYLPDDAHWNPRGVAVAAQALAEHLKSAPAPRP